MFTKHQTRRIILFVQKRRRLNSWAQPPTFPKGARRGTRKEEVAGMGDRTVVWRGTQNMICLPGTEQSDPSRLMWHFTRHSRPPLSGGTGE